LAAPSFAAVSDPIWFKNMWRIDWDPRVGGLVFWKEDKAPQSIAPHALLISTQTRKAAGADGRAARSNLFRRGAKCRKK